MSRFGRGLVVGKFSPLHLGHELLIERALALCDEVVLISYSEPELARCDRAERERWLAEKYPQATRLVVDDALLRERCSALGIDAPTLPRNDAPAEEHRALVAWLCMTLLDRTVDAVFTSESYGDAFAADLTRRFRAARRRSTGIRHVCVDPARAAVPISATEIRADPHARRAYLSPLVYASFVERVCLLGGESSGKSTLAKTLAARAGSRWAPEYGRELWEQRGGRLDFADMVAIAREQVRREEELARRARRWLFCDTSPLTTLLYSLELFGKADPELETLASRSYDHVFLCAPDFAFVQDGTRRDEAFRARQHAWYVAELTRRNVRFHLLEGTLEERLRRALSLLPGATAPSGSAQSAVAVTTEPAATGAGQPSGDGCAQPPPTASLKSPS